MSASTTVDLAEGLDADLLAAVALERTAGDQALDALADEWCRTVTTAADRAAYRQLAQATPTSVVTFPTRSPDWGRRAA